MLRGFYTAGSGLVTHEKRLNVHANNIANVSTVGFKKDNLVQGTFGEHMAVRMGQYQGSNTPEIGKGVYMATITDEYTDHSQGAYDESGRTLDMAIQGNGFFVLQTGEGEFLTRNGQFALDDEGYLVLPNYGRVLGEGGDIQIGTSFFTVDRDGTIFLDPTGEDEEPEEIDRILIVEPLEAGGIKKADQNDLFIAVEGYREVEHDEDGNLTGILHRVLERSNVNVAQEMSLIIANQRGLQSCSQIVKMYDDMADQANTRISRVQ